MRVRHHLLLAAGLALAAAPAARADGEARAVVEKAIQAHGGADKLAKLRGVRLQTKGTLTAMGMTGRFTAETVTRFPDRNKNIIQLDINNARIATGHVLSGDRAWSVLDGEVEELTGQRLAEVRTRAHVAHIGSLVPLVSDKAFSLSPVGEVTVNDRLAVGVRAARNGHADVNLYFGKASGLLVKAEVRGRNLNQEEVLREVFFGGYKDVGGLMYATAVRIDYDGRTYMEYEVTDVTFDDAIPDAEFAKP